MCSITLDIDNQENILRTIYSPANFNPKGKLRGNFMRPQFSKADEDDPTIASNKISVTRVDFVILIFVKTMLNLIAANLIAFIGDLLGL